MYYHMRRGNNAPDWTLARVSATMLNHHYDLHILAQRHSVAGPSQSATRRQTQPPAPMSPQYRRCARRPSSSAYTLAGGEQRAVLSCPHRPDPIQVRESGSRTVPAVPHSERNGTAMYRRALCAVHGGCPKETQYPDLIRLHESGIVQTRAIGRITAAHTTPLSMDGGHVRSLWVRPMHKAIARVGTASRCGCSMVG